MTTKQEIEDKMTEIMQGYEVNEADVIKNPGKFEGESPITLYFYDCMLNGFGTVMEAEAEELEYFELDPSTPFVYVAESNDGFVSLEFYATEAEAEEADSEDSEFEEDEAEDEEEIITESCPMCGTINGPMGSLGSVTWYRCQACGMEYKV